MTMLCVSRAPLEKLSAYKQGMGWEFDWVSAFESDLSFDVGVSFNPEQPAAAADHNFKRVTGIGDEMPGLSAFALEDGAVFHTYSTYRRGLDIFDNVYQLLDRRRSGATRPTATTGSAAATNTRQEEFHMKQVMVRYRVKPEQVEHNQELIREVFRELNAVEDADFQYASFLLDDGLSFVHLVSEAGDSGTSLANLPAFKRFQDGIRERCDEPPVVTGLKVVGTHRLIEGLEAAA